jgi:hypothetical protein
MPKQLDAVADTTSSHAFAVALQNAESLQTIRESMAPDSSFSNGS